MNAQALKHAAIGFLAAAGLAALPMLAFMLIPGAAMFLIFVPLWGVAVVVGLLLLLGFTGRYAHAGGVAVFAAAALVSPFGSLAISSVRFAADGLRTDARFANIVGDICSKDFVAPRRADLPPLTRIIFDDFGNISYAGYDPADMIALLTGREVIEIRRSSSRPVTSTIARPAGACGDSEKSRTIESVRMGQGPFPRPVKIGVCLDRRSATEPRLDEAAIILRRGKGGIMGCDVIDVIQRSGGVETPLGSVRYNHARDTFYPDLRRRGETRRGDWFLATLREALGQEISEKALLQREARN